MWLQFITKHHEHLFTHSLTPRGNIVKPICPTECFWEVKGNWRTQRKPSKIYGEKLKLHTDISLSSGSNPALWSCEPATLFITQHYCHVLIFYNIFIPEHSPQGWTLLYCICVEAIRYFDELSLRTPPAKGQLIPRLHGQAIRRNEIKYLPEDTGYSELLS